MLPVIPNPDRRHLKRKLFLSLVSSADILNHFSEGHGAMSNWDNSISGHIFSMSGGSCTRYECDSKRAIDVFKSWLQTHEEAQIMVGSILVVFGLWWLVRTIFTLFINLVCPLLFVLLAVLCVPQLRDPLLGQNYPVLANVLRSILLKMADNLKI